MNPEEKQQFDNLKKRVDDLEMAHGVDFIENIKERIIELFPVGEGEFSTTGISGSENGSNSLLRDIDINFPGGGSQTITVLDAPISVFEIKYRGNNYKLGVWE